jgi:hypothetical protein
VAEERRRTFKGIFSSNPSVPSLPFDFLGAYGVGDEFHKMGRQLIRGQGKFWILTNRVPTDCLRATSHPRRKRPLENLPAQASSQIKPN